MISVVIPFYNEISCVDPLIQRLRKTLSSYKSEGYEILIVDNGSSPDQDLQLKARFSESDDVRVVTLSRNFGYQGALWAGFDLARGDPIILIDGDGEDPPEVIAEFLAKWREGYDIVYGVRLSRQVTPFMSLSYKIFYRLLTFWSSIKIPLDAGEFSLVSGNALTALRRFNDRTRMFRILRAWVGFKQIGVPYHREARIAGKSKFRFLSAFAFAFDGFVAATDLPVRLSIYCGVFCFTLGILGSIYYVLWYFFGREKIPGFASLNITVLILFSMMFFCISVLGRYIITLLDETRARPPYIVSRDSDQAGRKRP